MKKFVLLMVLVVLVALASAKRAPVDWVDDKPDGIAEKTRGEPCPNNCSGHGRCLSTGDCACTSGWVGDDCSVSDVALTANQPVSATVQQRAWQYYHFQNSHEATLNWTVVQSSPSQDADLYITYNDYPTRYDYDYRDISTKQSFSVAIEDARSGTWYAGVYGFTQCSFSIIVQTESLCPNGCSGHGECTAGGECVCSSGWLGDDCSEQVVELSNDRQVRATVGFREWNYYSYEALNNNDLWFVVNQTSNSEDCDLYLKHGALPSLFDYEYRDDSVYQDFALQVTEPTPGAWYAGVYGFSECSYGIKVRSIAACPNECSGSDHGSCVGTGCSCDSKYSGAYCETMNNPMAAGARYNGFVEQDVWNYYHFSAQTSQNVNITVVQQNDGADCDLYIRSGQNPTRFQFDYRDVSLRESFSVIIENPEEAAMWYIGVYGYQECQYYIQGTATTLCPNDCSGQGTCHEGHCVCNNGYSGEDCSVSMPTLVSGRPVNGNLLQGSWAYYRIENVQSVVSVHLAETGSEGFLWLFASPDEEPTLRDHEWASTQTNSAFHTITVERSEHDPTTLIAGVYANPYAPDCTTPECRVSYEITAFITPF